LGKGKPCFDQVYDKTGPLSSLLRGEAGNVFLDSLLDVLLNLGCHLSTATSYKGIQSYTRLPHGRKGANSPNLLEEVSLGASKVTEELFLPYSNLVDWNFIFILEYKSV
jgi:hypothetical protein